METGYAQLTDVLKVHSNAHAYAIDVRDLFQKHGGNTGGYCMATALVTAIGIHNKKSAGDVIAALDNSEIMARLLPIFKDGNFNTGRGSGNVVSNLNAAIVGFRIKVEKYNYWTKTNLVKELETGKMVIVTVFNPDFESNISHALLLVGLPNGGIAVHNDLNKQAGDRLNIELLVEEGKIRLLNDESHEVVYSFTERSQAFIVEKT